MLRYYVITLLITASFCGYAQQWEIVSEPYTASTVQDLFFVSENVGWAVGTEGFIMHTTDGGESWEKQISGTDKDIAKVFFLDENNGWAGTGHNTNATAGGTVLKTTNGGLTWNEIDYTSAVPNVSFVYCDNIQFVNSQTGFMIAGKSKSNYLLKTTDGGLTWSKKDSLINASTALRWYGMDFYNENKGVVVGTAKNIQKYTTDGGETWNFSAAITDNFFKNLRTVKFISETEVVTLGEGQELNGVPTPVYKSFDGGATWVTKTQTPINSYDRVRGVYFKNSLEGIAVGTNGFAYPFIYKTTDGGETWAPSNANVGFSLSALSGSGDVLYALGTGSMLLKSTDFGETWNIYPVKSPASVYGLQFINNKGYAVLSNGTVIGSTDLYNENWEFISHTGLWLAYAMEFLDENTGIVLKENQHILKTVNGGADWNTVSGPVAFDSRNKVGGLAFGNSTTGYAWMSLNDYSEYHVFKTTDAGDNWSDIFTISGPGSLSGDIGFFDANTGFLAGPDMWVKITANGGTTWSDPVINNLPASFATRDIEAINVVNDNTAWIFGASILLKTTDKGQSWNYSAPAVMESDTSFYTMSFFDDNIGCIGTFDGVIYTTSDGGVNWEKDITYKGVYRFYSSAFNKFGEMYFGTSNGNIIKYKTTPTVSVEDNAVSVNSFKLDQNYPNPFNPSTTFSFNIAEQGKVTLKIYDVLGREAATVLDEELASGSHNIRFDASELSSGIYFYTLKSGKFSSTQKMVLMK